MAQRRGVVRAVAACLVLAACGGDDGDPEALPLTTTTGVAEESSSTTTSAPAETTTTPTTAPAIEPPANTGTDMVAVLQSLSDFGNRLGMAPDLAAVDLAYHPDSPAHERAAEIASSLVNNGWHWSAPTEILSEIVDNDGVGERSWLMAAVSTRNQDAVLLDAAGVPVEEQPPSPAPQRLVYQLVRGDDDRWRIAEIELLGEAG